MTLLTSYDDADLLLELARRGVIHPTRLTFLHHVQILDDGYRMTHPLDCDLATCPFDDAASRWGPGVRPPGLYAMPSTDPEELTPANVAHRAHGGIRVPTNAELAEAIAHLRNELLDEMGSNIAAVEAALDELRSEVLG